MFNAKNECFPRHAHRTRDNFSPKKVKYELNKGWQRSVIKLPWLLSPLGKHSVIAFDQPKNVPISVKSIIGDPLFERSKHEEQLDVNSGQSSHRRYETNGWRKINGMQFKWMGCWHLDCKMDADYYIFRENYSISINMLSTFCTNATNEGPVSQLRKYMKIHWICMWRITSPLSAVFLYCCCSTLKHFHDELFLM